MIVAMVAVVEVKMVADDVVDMVAVRDRLVSTARAVDVGLVMAAALVVRSAGVRIAAVFGEPMLVHVVAVHIVHVPVVQIIGMAVVVDRRMTAAGTMLMVMFLMGVARAVHGNFSSIEKQRISGTLPEV